MVASLYLMTCNVCVPVTTGEPPQLAVNLMGIVLFILNVRSGASKLPPVASAPPIGARKPLNWNITGFTVTVNEHEAECWQASLAVQFTVVVPTGNAEPEGGLQVMDMIKQDPAAVGFGKFTTKEAAPHGAVDTMFAGHVIVGGVDEQGGQEVNGPNAGPVPQPGAAAILATKASSYPPPNEG